MDSGVREGHTRQNGTGRDREDPISIGEAGMRAALDAIGKDSSDSRPQNGHDCGQEGGSDEEGG